MFHTLCHGNILQLLFKILSHFHPRKLATIDYKMTMKGESVTKSIIKKQQSRNPN